MGEGGVRKKKKCVKQKNLIRSHFFFFFSLKFTKKGAKPVMRPHIHP